MKAVDVKTINMRANRAANRRRDFFVHIGVIVVIALVIIAGLGWAMFFSGWFDIRDIRVDGLTAEHESSVREAIAEGARYSFWHVPVGKNILFFKDQAATRALKSNFSFIDTLTIKKDLLHALNIEATERQPAGVWCFESTTSMTTACRYFDDQGLMWGNPAPSSGFLLLNVNDQRDEEAKGIDTKLLASVQTVVKGLSDQGIAVKGVILPIDVPTEFDVKSGESYVIKFSTDSNLPIQLDTFRIFRDQTLKKTDIHPQYLDLRFDGRVYYR